MDVVTRVVRVHGSALCRVRLITDMVKAMDREVPDDERPRPHGCD